MKTRILLPLAILVLAGSLVLGACSTSEDEQTIKIGVLASLTGPLAQEGIEHVMGIELALDEVGYEVAGKEIELITEDIGVDPGLCLTKVKKLNEVDNVDLVLGPSSVGQILAIRDYIDENELLTISPMCPTPKMTGELYTPYFFRSSYNYNQENALAAYIAYEEKGYRKVAAIFVDIEDGHGNWEPFKEVFEGLGGEVVLEIATPMETPDYAPYMAQIDAENTDVIWSFHLGGDAIRFVQALDEYGIKDEVPVLCSPATVSEGWLAPMGDAALGIESTTNYSPVLDTPENTEFAQALWDKDQQRPTIPIEHGYVAARMAILALEEVDGDVSDLDSLIEALENLEFEAPRGPIKFEQHTPVQNLYHRVVERVDGELQNTVVGTYPDIGPVWVPAGLE